MTWDRKRRPTHPGVILRQEFLAPLEMTQTKLADKIGVSRVRVHELVRGKRGVTPDTALRLGKLFDIEPKFWLDLQQAHDLWDAGRDGKTQRALEKITPVGAAS